MRREEQSEKVYEGKREYRGRNRGEKENGERERKYEPGTREKGKVRDEKTGE